VVVQVPAAGSSGTFSVTVTDGAGNQATASLAVSGIDPNAAGKRRHCVIRSRRCIGSNDPSISIREIQPREVLFNPYSLADLKSLEELSREVSVQAGALQREHR
jgi:hypothetical protein